MRMMMRRKRKITMSKHPNVSHARLWRRTAIKAVALLKLLSLSVGAAHLPTPTSFGR